MTRYQKKQKRLRYGSVKLGKLPTDPALLPERLIRERAAKEKRTFFRDAHSDRLDTFDGGDFVVGQILCAETAREFAASQQAGNSGTSDNESGHTGVIHSSFRCCDKT